jgi:hypothetical protein
MQFLLERYPVFGLLGDSRKTAPRKTQARLESQNQYPRSRPVKRLTLPPSETSIVVQKMKETPNARARPLPEIAGHRVRIKIMTHDMNTKGFANHIRSVG